MKFGKEFSSQIIHGWQHDYMDYDSLKKHLKQLRSANALTRGGTKNHHAGILKRIYSSLILSISGRQTLDNSHDVEAMELKGTTTTTEPIEVTIADGQVKTKILIEKEEGGYESEFFQRLDNEVNKVIKVSKKTVENVENEAEKINKQMEDGSGRNDKEIKHSSWIPKFFPTIMGFRVSEEPEEREKESTPLASGLSTCSEAFSPTPGGVKVESQGHMEIVVEGQSTRTGQYTTDGVKSNNTKLTDSRATTPKVSRKTGLKFSTDNLSKSEQKLRKDYIELYWQLGLLKSYRSSNVMAVSKILKKYDKITKRNASKLYTEVVDNWYQTSSAEVVRLMENVEAKFIKHFAESNRAEGMKMLRPKPTRDRHRLTFSTGFTAGCVFSLIVALATIIRTRNSLQGDGQEIYMNTMFPLYSWFGFVMLHIIMYAANLHYWRRYKINYSKIFGFKQGTEPRDRQVLLVAFTIGVFALLCVLGNLDMEVDPNTKDYQKVTELLPLFLLIGIVGVVFFPFKYFYHSNRKFYVTCFLHCIAAPFYEVSFADSFFGDQFTSQVQALRSFEFYICYYGWGDFKRRKNTCTDSHVYKAFFFIVAVIPFLSRLLQCLRRLFDDKHADHRWNGLKYFLTIVAVCFRTAYSIQPGQIAWRVIAIIFSVVAAIFGTYWDFVHDWGLLKPESQNRWLRDNLLIPQKEVYFIAMILNVLLRFAWIQTVLDFNLPFRHSTQTMVAVVASLEIIRRGIWNFFRLENEHLKNVKEESSHGGDKHT